MKISLLIMPFLLNSFTINNSNEVNLARNISANEIACNYCWIYKDENEGSIFNPSYVKQCDENKVVVKKKSEYRCAVNLVYDDVISFNLENKKTSYLSQYKFALTATKKTSCKTADTLCTSSLSSCGQSYICCDENYCNSPNNLNLHITKYYGNSKIFSECLSMSFKNKNPKGAIKPIIAKESAKLLKTHYCNYASSTNKDSKITLSAVAILVCYLNTFFSANTDL